MIIEVNKSYIANNGNTAVIRFKVNEEKYPYVGYVLPFGGNCFDDDPMYCEWNENGESIHGEEYNCIKEKN